MTILTGIPLNPNDPPKRVTGGNSSSDEMAHLWLQVLPRARASTEANDPRRVLQEALARHNVEKNPADFEAHYNLAAMLRARGELAKAAEAVPGWLWSCGRRCDSPNNAFAAATAGQPQGIRKLTIGYLEAAALFTAETILTRTTTSGDGAGDAGGLRGAWSSFSRGGADSIPRTPTRKQIWEARWPKPKLEGKRERT